MSVQLCDFLGRSALEHSNLSQSRYRSHDARAVHQVGTPSRDIWAGAFKQRLSLSANVSRTYSFFSSN